MRMIYFVILLVLLGAVGVFAYQNQQGVTLTFLDRSISSTMAVVAVSTYLAGMISGWSVIRMFRRSLHQVSSSNR